MDTSAIARLWLGSGLALVVSTANAAPENAAWAAQQQAYMTCNNLTSATFAGREGVPEVVALAARDACEHRGYELQKALSTAMRPEAVGQAMQTFREKALDSNVMQIAKERASRR